MTPLLHPAARARRRAVLERSLFATSGDPLLDTPFDPVLHAVSFAALPADLLELLCTVEHDTHPVTGRVVRRRAPLWVQQQDGITLANRLVPLVQQYFRRACGRPTSPPAAPDTTTFAGLADPLVPAALAAYGRAVVRYGRGVCLARLVEQLVRTNLAGRAAVVCKNRQQVGQVVADLRRNGVDAGAFFELTFDGRPRPAVAVGTPAGLASPSAAVDHVGLVVVLDPVGFCGPRGIGLRMVENLVGVPWLGLLPADRPLAPLERDLVTAFFGPFQYELPAHGQVKREVVFARQPVVLPKESGYERVVVRLAGELAGREGTGGCGRFVVVSQAAGVDGPVAVLAHDDAHRRVLRGVQRSADRSRVRIVTPAELAGLTDIGVLVRADRRSHHPSLPPAVLVEPQTARRPLLVVDATGPGDEPLSRRQLTAYRTRDWVSLEAYCGGWAEWERWLHRRLPGSRQSG